MQEQVASRTNEEETVPKWERVADLADLRGDGPHALAASGTDLVVVRTKSGLRAYGARCPHQGALLGEGELDGDALVCRNHRWRFDAATGRRIGGPQCLRACAVREDGGSIEIDARSLARIGEERASKVAARSLDDLPSPSGLPLFGSMFDLDIDRLHLVFEKWERELGPYFVVRAGPRRLLVSSDPAAIQTALRARPETFRRLSVVETVFEEMGVGGVFSAEGTDWRPQRRLAMEALAHRHLRGFYPTLRKVAERFHRRWLVAAEAGRVLDLCEELQRFTVDVTTLLVFGRDLRTLEGGEDDVIQRHLEHVFPALNRRLNGLVPYWRYLKLPQDRRLERALAALRVWLEEVIRETRATLDADPSRAEHPHNFLEAMLTAKDEDGHPFSDATIFGNAMTMLLAGEDTTANTLAWAMHELLEAPAEERALRAEANAVLGSSRIPEDMEQANRLVYAAAVASETMRLRPVAPLFFMEPIHDTVLGDVAMPKGQGFVLLMRPPAVQASHFADPHLFKPERWLERADRDRGAEKGAHDPSSHLPFGSGPRICPGRALALLEMKLVLGLIYRSFEVVRVGAPRDVTERFAFTMTPAHLRVRLRRRA